MPETSQRPLTLLALSIINSQSEQRWSFTPHQIHLSSLEVQLEDGSVHVVGPKYIIQVVRDPERVIDFFAIIYHLNEDSVLKSVNCNYPL